jgi:hypothetical protein
MFSTREIQPSNAEIEVLAAEIQRVPSKNLRSALQTQLFLIRASADASPVELLCQWLSRATSTENVEKVCRTFLQPPFVIETCTDCDVKINANETTKSKIAEVFDLSSTAIGSWWRRIA